MSLKRAFERPQRRRVLVAFGLIATALLLVLGVFASNGWLPQTDPMTGKKFGWFGRPVSEPGAVATGAFPSGTPQLSKEYIYAGGRLLAVEDANAGAATPTPTPHGFEGDVAPGDLGDGAVISNDVTTVRNFATGLETPATSPNEFQRADTFPRSTFGDAIINSSDVVQVRRYSTGLDPLTPAGGPVSPNEGPESATNSSGYKPGANIETAATRELRVMPATGRRGETITLPIQMKLDRDEVAVAFTLEFDAARLSNPRVTLGSGLPASAYLTTNTTQPGKIGILVDAEEPFSSTPREMMIVYVTFDIRATALTGPSPVLLTSSLARQSVADRMANLVEVSYANGIVSIND